MQESIFGREAPTGRAPWKARVNPLDIAQTKSPIYSGFFIFASRSDISNPEGSTKMQESIFGSARRASAMEGASQSPWFFSRVGIDPLGTLTKFNFPSLRTTLNKKNGIL